MGNEERQFAGKLPACEQALCQSGERVASHARAPLKTPAWEARERVKKISSRLFSPFPKTESLFRHRLAS